jgi:predicted PurR-regulated permease PerM
MAQLTSLPKLTPRRVILATITVSLVVLAFWLIILFRYVFIILFLGIVLSLAIRPAVSWLNRHSLPRGAGVAVVYLGLLAFLTGFILLLVPLLADQVASIINNLPNYYQTLRGRFFDSHNLLLLRLGLQLPPTLPFLSPAEQPAEDAVVTVGQTWEYTLLLSRYLFMAVAVLLLGFYWTLDGERIVRSLVLLFPMDWREGIRELLTAVEVKVGAYIFGQIILSIFIFAMNLIAFLLIGLPYPLFLAVFAGIMEAVPMAGPVLGAIPAVLLALSLGEPTKVLWVVLATIIIQQFENAVLVPRIMRRAVGVNPLVTLLSLLAFTSVLGIVGALIAIPIAAILQLLVNRLLLEPGNGTNQEEIVGRDSSSRLRYEVQQLVQDVRKQIRSKDVELEDDIDKAEDEIETIATELDNLLAEISPVEKAEAPL